MLPYFHPDLEDAPREADRLEWLEKRLRTLEEEVNLLRRLVHARRQVDLIDTTELYAYLYTDDLAYRQLDDRYKRASPPASPRALPHRPPEDRYANPSEPLLPLLFSHFWLHGLDFTYLDIGCQYAIGAMAAAQIIQSSGRQGGVIAFDPGVAAQLVPYSLRINGLDSIVRFEPLAVCDATRPAIVFAGPGHSEDNRIVNPGEAPDLQSYVVPATSVDDYIESHCIDGPLIVKVDTQGAEVEVFRGMQRSIANRTVAILSEFTPHAIAGRCDPQQWLSERLSQFRIFDLGELDILLHPHRRLPEVADGAALVPAMEQAGRDNTDLLLLPRDLPGIEGLEAKLALPGGRASAYRAGSK